MLTVVVHVGGGAVLERCFVDFIEFENYLKNMSIPLAVGLDGSKVLQELTSLFTNVNQVE